MAFTNADLVAGLKREGIISSPFVERAMLAVDRGLFIPQNPYVDSPQDIGSGQTISAPHMHAYALELLKDAVDKSGLDIRFLDVGSGSGYFCALLAAANREATVEGIELVPELVELGKKNLQKLGWERVPEIRQGSGWQSLGVERYDAIHVGAAAASLPTELVKALKVGGLLLIPLGPQHDTQFLTLVHKKTDNEYTTRRVMAVRYVPLVDQKN